MYNPGKTGYHANLCLRHLDSIVLLEVAWGGLITHLRRVTEYMLYGVDFDSGT